MTNKQSRQNETETERIIFEENSGMALKAERFQGSKSKDYHEQRLMAEQKGQQEEDQKRRREFADTEEREPKRVSKYSKA